jgi:hypothetical protein
MTAAPHVSDQAHDDHTYIWINVLENITSTRKFRATWGECLHWPRQKRSEVQIVGWGRRR